MTRCDDVDRLMTPFVDGEISPEDREAVEAHLERCPPCRHRASAEAAARDVIRSHAGGIRADAAVQAPLDLKARCAAAARQRADIGAPGRSRGLWSLATAAIVVLAVGGVLGLVLTRTSTTVMAAQLTADHLKCYKMFPPERATDDPRLLEARIAEQCGWPVRIPSSEPGLHLTLIGARRCLFGDGHVAHLMYMHGDTPMSLFIIPRRQSDESALQVFGHQARVWSRDGRTYVLVGREDEAEIRRVAQYAQSVTH
ncbi:MAG: anti-sigma factor [Acidobacteria bacterium]|nr:anti-sigma factor [Acidobacteriota bacterium]